MTLSWPSFLAAVTSLSSPPRSPALVALAALLEPELLSLGGGEHAAAVRARVTARVAVARRVAARAIVVCTFPPLRRLDTEPTCCTDHRPDMRTRPEAPRSVTSSSSRRCTRRGPDTRPPPAAVHR